MPVLQFKGKSVIESYHHTVPHHRLEFDAGLSLLPKKQKPGLDGNLIIEGDNLLALKALLPTHAGRVKCIYIDPPYNTGNEGWVYNDNLTQPQFKEWVGQTVGKEGEDACRHDKWCCMMYPRLMLLKELLRDDGSIWISIDDNEVHALREIMDEIFGEDNFVATVIWEKVYSPKSSAKHLSENHDYIVVYAKKKDEWPRRLLPRTEEANARYSNPDNDPRGDWKPSDLSARNYYSKGTYAIECPSGRVIEKPPEGRYYSVSEDDFWDLDEDKRIWWGEDGNSAPSTKRFLSEVRDLVPETIWTYRDFGETPPAFADLARYVFYTETSSEADEAKFDPESGFIGQTKAGGGTSYYLLYDPAIDKDRELSLKTLAQLNKSDKNRNWVIYCEKFWMHTDQLQKLERENGKRIRHMLVPFQLK